MSNLRLGEGYRVDYENYRLFVQVTEEGWTVQIRDLSRKKWNWKEIVDNPEEGKLKAIEALQANLSTEQKHVVLADSLEWEHYGASAVG